MAGSRFISESRVMGFNRLGLYSRLVIVMWAWRYLERDVESSNTLLSTDPLPRPLSLSVT